MKRSDLKRTIADIRVLETLIGCDDTEMLTPPDDLGAAADPLPSDSCSSPYEYIKIAGEDNPQCRRNKNLHPINSDYDLYTKKLDGDKYGARHGARFLEASLLSPPGPSSWPSRSRRGFPPCASRSVSPASSSRAGPC